MKETNEERSKRHRAERLAFKQELEIKYNTSGHQKADILFDIAWDYGHSDGWNYIEAYYATMCVLLT